MLLMISAKACASPPHIFGDVVADTSEEVLSNWDAIKAEEKGVILSPISFGRAGRAAGALCVRTSSGAYRVKQALILHQLRTHFKDRRRSG